MSDELETPTEDVTSKLVSFTVNKLIVGFIAVAAFFVTVGGGIAGYHFHANSYGHPAIAKDVQTILSANAETATNLKNIGKEVKENKEAIRDLQVLHIKGED